MERLTRAVRLVRWAPLVLVLIAVAVGALSHRTLDLDVQWCNVHNGEVVTEEYPHQADVHRCEVDGETVRAWKRVDGENVLIVDWSVNW